MTHWKSLLQQTAVSVETRFDQLKANLSFRLGLNDPLMIQPFDGFGTATAVSLIGRVLENKGINQADDNDSVWDNLLNIYRQLESDEVAGAVVQGSIGGVVQTAVTNDEGYFMLQFDLPNPLPATERWHYVSLQLLSTPYHNNDMVTATGRVLVPPETAVFGVISDIDDTVLKSSATDYLEAARLLFLQNARSRLPFAGVAAFYQALLAGRHQQQNPIFYVSSSPWNIYPLLTDFFDFHNIPAGPLLLKDYGLTPSQFFSSGHRQHKLTQIDTILTTYPHLPFVLIGDSGQKDPEIYAELVHTYPGRIKAIYIRDVSEDARDAAVWALAKTVKTQGVDMILAADSLAAAQHAVQTGLFPAAQLARIAAEKEDYAHKN
jgi:phosphatidate phosphatase APP1